MGEFIHEGLDGKYVGVSPEAAGGRNPERHLGDEMGYHPLPGKFVKGNGVPVRRIIGWAAILRDRLLKRFLEIET